MIKDYYLGLDIGTNSVGWAVTDTDYKLCRARGNDMWGSYLFDDAKKAVERRTFRTTRRRLARTRRRIMLLQELFAEEVSKVDPLFFIRLNNGALFASDKDGRLTSANNLFDDHKYKDKDYFKQFPTIYHLRAHLLTEEVTDVRLLYLAVHHILKHRGHFLFEAQDIDGSSSSQVEEMFDKLNSILSDSAPDFDDNATLPLEKIDEAISILSNQKITKKTKTDQITKLFSAKKGRLKEIVSAITGKKFKLSVLYDNDDLTESYCFDEPDFNESKLPQIEEQVGIDEAELVRTLKAIYDWSRLDELLGGEKYLSKAKTKIFDKHHKDLDALKKYIKDNCPEKYNLIFKAVAKKKEDDGEKSDSQKDVEPNYASYVGKDGKKSVSKCEKDEFYKYLKKTIAITDKEMLESMERGDFLPKQVTGGNGVIPYQVHLAELSAILQNAEKYLPFLASVSDGLTVSERIKSLMTFRIPYYVGPLNTLSKFAWVQRKSGKENTTVTPWNFDDVVDRDASEQKFISRMTNKCTYLVGEDVLPAKSLLYSEFAFLNELNNLKVNGEKSPEAKQVIYEYAKEEKNVTLNKCLKLLIRKGLLEKGSDKTVFTGLDEDFKNSMSSYVDFNKLLNGHVDEKREMCEEIILWITLISDKKRLAAKIEKKYGNELSQEQINTIKGFNYSKWGRLSQKLLDGICVEENGEQVTIISAMRNRQDNFMVLAEGAYRKAIDEHNSQNTLSDKVTYATVADLYCSPSVKRGIWRSIELVREIVKICGGPPKRIFIEMAREVNDGTRKGNRTITRKQQLLDLYKNIKGEERNWKKEIETNQDEKFNSPKLVLYYRQMGRSMYSGKPIRLEDVFNENICDIDHIFPRSKLKDDSFDNRVLVFKTENQEKKDNYPVDAQIRDNMHGFWEELCNKGLISKTKLERLKRSTPLTTSELTDFINRQLVETRQSTKAAAQILTRLFPTSKIVYSKAGNVDDFKKERKLIKVRELNNLHHAKDAFINIVVGNVYYTKFTENAANYFKRNNIDSYNLKYLFAKNIDGAWDVSKIGDIEKTYRRNTCRVVRFSSIGKGGLFDQKLRKAGKNKNLIPRKEHGAISDTAKYGGYEGSPTKYFALVRSLDRKGKTQLSIETISIYDDRTIKGDLTALKEHCENRLGLRKAEILISRIKTNTLFSIDGSYAYIRGKSGSQIVWCNATELFLDDTIVAYLKEVSNHFRKATKLKNPKLPVNEEKISAESNLDLYDEFCKKLKSRCYAGFSNISNQAKFLESKREKFTLLTLSQQCTVIMEILKLMQCNSEPSNFKLLGGGKRVGTILISKNIQNRSVKMIDQSLTGHYCRVIDFADYL